MSRHHRFCLLVALVFAGCNGPSSSSFSSADDFGPPSAGEDQFVPVPPTSLKIVVRSPERGAMLTGDPKAVVLAGHLEGDLAELKWLELDGDPLKVTADGSFQAPLSAAWGLNVFTLEARAKAGATVRHVQSFHYGTAYGRPSDLPTEDGVIIRLRDQIFEDGDRSDLDDFSSIAEVFMNAIELDPLVPTVLLQGGMLMMSYSATKAGKLTAGKMAVSMFPIAGGMRLEARAPWLEVPLRLSAGPMSVTGLGRVEEISIAVDAMISKTCAGSLSVAVSRVDVSFGKVTIDMGSGLPAEMMSTMINMLTTFFRDDMRASIQRHVAGLMPAFFTSFIEAIAMPSQIQLPNGNIAQQASLCRVSFDDDGGTIGMKVALSAEQVVPDPKRGWLLQDLSPPSFAFSHSVAVLTEANVLNQLLYNAWTAGAIGGRAIWSAQLTGIDVASLPIDTKSFKVSTEPLLPPTLMPGQAADEVSMAVGDLRLIYELSRADGSPSTITAYLSVIQPATTGYSAQQQITLTPSRPPVVARAQVLETTGLTPAEAAAAATFVERTASSIVEHLAAGTVKGFRLPYIDTGVIVVLGASAKIVMQGDAVDYAAHRVRVSGEMGLGL